jgi:[ribosomal protein S18]-alanine N-acetyltransferase
VSQGFEPLYRIAQPTDLPAVAQVFAAAFPDSVAHVVGTLQSPEILADLFALALRAEPESMTVAEIGTQVVGYALTPARTSRLPWVAFWSGAWARMLGKLLTGRYRISLRAVRLALADKVSFLRGAKRSDRVDARILSIAVHPDFQGYGLGRGLLAAGLDYLHRQQVPAVRLEVRPDNQPAIHLYEKAGFRPRGTYQDAQGPWLIMVKTGESDSRATT